LSQLNSVKRFAPVYNPAGRGDGNRRLSHQETHIALLGLILY